MLRWKRQTRREERDLEARLQLFAGSSNPALAQEIVGFLGVPRGRASVGAYEDGETRIRLAENVRGSELRIHKDISLTSLFV